MASVAGSRLIQSLPAIQTFSPQSSFIGALEYDQTNLTLTTHMLSGAIYQHKFVTPADWLALQTAQNHGRHWSIMLRGKKASVRVKSAKAPRSELKHKHHV